MTDDRQDDFDRGVKNRRAVLGDAWVDKSLDNATEFNAEFQHLITRYAWHDIWGRPGLDNHSRALATLGVLIGKKRMPILRYYARIAMRQGVTEEQLGEVALQAIPYTGFPTAVAAAQIMREVAKEIAAEQAG